MKRVALLVIAAIAYAIAAWGVAPGFYDGFGPQPYAFTCPPPQAGANQKPMSGHADIKVIGGVSDANSAFTNDGQFVMGFLPGAFNADSQTTITVDIAPLSTCPQPSGIRFVTNVYEVTCSAPLVKDSNVTMLYSNLEPDPTAIYFSTSAGGPWTSLGAQSQAQPWTIWTKTRNCTGYFAAGYPVTSPPPGPKVGGGQALPIIVAVLIVIVVLAGLPLAVIRRRQGGATEDEP